MLGAKPAAVSAAVSRARLTSSSSSSPMQRAVRARSRRVRTAATTSACTVGAPSGRGAQNGSRATTWIAARGCSSAVRHQVSVSDGSGSTATDAAPADSSAIACAGLPCTRSGVSAPKCSRASWVIGAAGMRIAHRQREPALHAGWCRPASRARCGQMACGGSEPAWRASSRRMIDASRPGRSAARLPDRATSSTTRARCISRSWIASSMRSSAARSPARWVLVRSASGLAAPAPRQRRCWGRSRWWVCSSTFFWPDEGRNR